MTGAIYAAGAYGFRQMRSWMFPWAAVYVGQVAFAMLVWNWIYVGGFLGFLLGIIGVVPFGFLALMLWNARPLFQEPPYSVRQAAL